PALGRLIALAADARHQFCAAQPPKVRDRVTCRMTPHAGLCRVCHHFSLHPPSTVPVTVSQGCIKSGLPAVFLVFCPTEPCGLKFCLPRTWSAVIQQLIHPVPNPHKLIGGQRGIPCLQLKCVKVAFGPPLHVRR